MCSASAGTARSSLRDVGLSFPCFCFCKIRFSLVASWKGSGGGMGSWPLPCLFGQASFSLWFSSSQEIAGPQRCSWGADAVLKDPSGKKSWEKSSSIFLLGWEWEWEFPQSSWFRSCVSGWNLTTKSSHTPWGQQKPPAASEANKRR